MVLDFQPMSLLVRNPLREMVQRQRANSDWLSVKRTGDRILKKSRYIPTRLLARVEKMNNEKVPVAEILRVLRNRSKRKK